MQNIEEKNRQKLQLSAMLILDLLESEYQVGIPIKKWGQIQESVATYISMFPGYCANFDECPFKKDN